MKKQWTRRQKAAQYLARTSEDLRFLQKKISGRSVYAAAKKAYRRIPKHRKTYLFQ